MERRKDTRRPHRIKVRFMEHGTEKRGTGYTTNISNTGMHVTTSRLLPGGKRIRVELRSNEGASVIAEAVVARAERSSHQMKPDTMGVRFLTPEELVAELVPGAPPQDEEPESTDDDEGLYRFRFADHQQFMAAYQRDLKSGRLFIPTDHPAPVDETVAVELRVANASPMHFLARVVDRIEPGDGNLMAGMDVELQGFEQTLEALRLIMESTGGAAEETS